MSSLNIKLNHEVFLFCLGSAGTFLDRFILVRHLVFYFFFKEWLAVSTAFKPNLLTIVKMYAFTIQTTIKLKMKFALTLIKTRCSNSRLLTGWLLWEASVHMAAVTPKPRGVLLAATALMNLIASYRISSLTFPNSSQWLSRLYFWWPNNVF